MYEIFQSCAYNSVATHQKTQQGLKPIRIYLEILLLKPVATHQKTQQGLKLRTRI